VRERKFSISLVNIFDGYECCKECFRKGLPNRLGIGSTDSC
jgi:hypothetical protein